MPAAGVERRFVENLVRQHVSPDLFALTQMMSYYLLDSEFAILRREMVSDGEATILTGLLSQRNLQIAVSNSLRCNPIGQLVSWPQAILCLAICSGRALLSSTQPSVRDIEIFQQNGLDLLWEQEEMIIWILKKVRALRIEGHWTLHERGATRPRDILGDCFATASSITVYDRFFRRATLDTLLDALEYASGRRDGNMNCRLTIFHGESALENDLGFVDFTTAKTELAKIVDQGWVVLEKIVRGPGKRHWLHDRFVQIDESSTFLFTSGVGCFFEGRNARRPNRSGHIVQFRVEPDYEEFEFFVRQGGGLKRRVLRT